MNKENPDGLVKKDWHGYTVRPTPRRAADIPQPNVSVNQGLSVGRADPAITTNLPKEEVARLHMKGSIHSRNAAQPDLEVLALKSLVSDYALRAKQAEEMCNTLLNEKIPQQSLLPVVTAMMTQHSEHRASERAVHQQAVLQSLLFLLTEGLGKPESELRDAVNKALKQTTLALGPMYNQPS